MKPDYRLELGEGLTLAWDVMVYGQPNLENVKKFVARFEESAPVVGSKRIVDQSTGKVIIEVPVVDTPVTSE